jgi:hypothetical protein
VHARIVCILAIVSSAVLTTALAAEPSPSEIELFEKKVRPLLVERCYSCHSAEAKKLKGGLRLDSAEGWLKGGDTGPAVVAGEPDKSLLIEAVRYANPDMEMPPKGKLADGEVAVLVEWVKRGAIGPKETPVASGAGKRVIDLEAGRKHWAYQPIGHPAPPAVKDVAWPRNDVDRFILAKLEEHGLQAAPEAAPAALVRRLYFDLTGLPPTPAEIDEYLNDARPDRYERLVDRLLASPRYGERWGRHWLDVARYGESLTLRGFILKDAWHYRDYVIESFNADRPFERFMKEQVAGDLMTADSIDERRRQIVATAFLAMGNNNLEEQDKKQLEMDLVDEQIDTIGRAFLAQTIGCARCHDHKFDPIPTSDYYALAGILHSTTTLEHANVSKWMEAPLPVDPAMEEPLRRHEAAVAELTERIKVAKAVVAKARGGKSPGIVAVADLVGFVVDDEQAKRVGEWKHSTNFKTYVGEGYLVDEGTHPEAKTLTFILPEAAESGKYEVRFAYTAGTNRAAKVPVTVFSADGEKTIEVDQRDEPPIGGHFVSLGQYNFEKNGQSFVIVSNQGGKGSVIADAVQFLPAELVAATEGAKAQPAGAKPQAAGEVKELEAELKKLIESGPKREAVISVKEAKEIADQRICVRGSVHTLGDVAPRGFLRVVAMNDVPAMPKEQSGRRELGEWLASPQNPLPARVMANRVWHWLMGEGLVRTTDNFGTTGEPPSHAELLDYLARRLIDGGWSVKGLVREIVLSRTYRMACGESPSDPENRLLSHASRRRLDAECIRDGMLLVSGDLKPAAGGRTYKEGMTSDFAFKQTDTVRSVYLPVFRNALPEIFEAFDFADPSVSTGRRNVSTVPPQALFMMNHPFVAEQAKHTAGRLMALGLADDAARAEWAYRVTLGRSPAQREKDAVVEYVRRAGDSADAWGDVFHALFGSVEFRYVE